MVIEKRETGERGPSGEAPPSAGVCICARWRRSVGVRRGCTRFAHTGATTRSSCHFGLNNTTLDPYVIARHNEGTRAARQERRRAAWKDREGEEMQLIKAAPPAWPRNYVCTSLRPRGLRGWLRFLPVCAATTVCIMHPALCARPPILFISSFFLLSLSRFSSSTFSFPFLSLSNI